MPAYMIAEMTVNNPDHYERYKAAAGDIIKKYGGRYEARGGSITPLEGASPQPVVVVEFDNVEAARRWYQSDDYQVARKLSEGAAIGRLYIV